jgi:hypothetical protein
MTPEQLDVLLAIANKGAYLAPSDPSAGFEARASAASDLASMRQPITADNLNDSGWVISPEEEAYWTPALANNPNTVWVQPDGDNPAIVEVEWALEEQHIPFVDVRTMYDLRELVRLLGGENA